MGFLHNVNDKFSVEKFLKGYFFNWVFIIQGLLLFATFYLLSTLLPLDNFWGALLRNFGFVFAIISLTQGYTATHLADNYPKSFKSGMKDIFSTVYKKSHVFIGLVFSLFAAILLILFVEVGLTYLGYIPYVGYFIVALLTLPYFAVNFISLLLAFAILLIFPLAIVDGKNVRESILDFKGLVRKEGAHIFLYLIVSAVCLGIVVFALFYAARYALGITETVQWKISRVYPKFYQNFSLDSFLTNIIALMTPRPDSVYKLSRMGSGYTQGLKYLVSIGFLTGGSLLLALPLTVFFNISSVFYKNIKHYNKEAL